MPDENPELTTKDQLNNILKPYRQQYKYREKVITLINKVMRGVEKDDFFILDELLNSKLANELVDIEELADCKPLFDELRNNSNQQIEQYRIQFIEDLQTLANEVELPITVDFPHFSILPGIAGEIQFSSRKTTLNKKTIKTIDPQRIVTASSKLKQQLYSPNYDASQFIGQLFSLYKQSLKTSKQSIGSEIPIQEFYLSYVLSLQSKSFFSDMDKGKFKGCDIDQFAINIWRYYESEMGDIDNTYALKLRPGRNNSLWLIDSQGEKRQITSIAFQERK